MAPTIDDVARVAGVSTSTVSRAIADNPRISRRTKDKISRVMKELNYHPNMIARSLASRSTNIIGVVIPGSAEKAFRHPFYPEVLRGITAAAHKYDYNILICDAIDEKEEQRILNKFVNGGITEGIIFMSSMTNNAFISDMLKMEFPFVMVGRPVQDEKINWVDNDNINIAYELTQKLIQAGHRSIAFLGLTPGMTVTTDRYEGYRKALAEAGIGLDEGLVIQGIVEDDNGYEMAKRLMAQYGQNRGQSALPTAIIALDDNLAFGAIKYLKESDYKVPKDISVVGFNNVPLSEFFSPALTSVEVFPYMIGSSALELLMTNIKSENKYYNRTIVPAKIIERDSIRSMEGE